LRDTDYSPKALSLVGVDKKRIECTFDDALFFCGMSRKKIFEFLKQYGVDSGHLYLAVNVHFWGQERDRAKTITNQIAVALDRIQSEINLVVVFIPMVKSDEAAIYELADLMKSPWVLPNHEYNLELSVGLIANATLCLTMKHHPIIFSMGACVPTVSIAFDDYYLHKNKGALKIFGLEEYIISCDAETLSQAVVEKTIRAYKNREEISQKISARIEQLRPRSGEIITHWLDRHGVHANTSMKEGRSE
jgi:polysaccharide pyruvyl transferase WcaK-like protein